MGSTRCLRFAQTHVNPVVLQKEDGKKHDFFHNSGARFNGGLLDRRVHG